MALSNSVNIIAHENIYTRGKGRELRIDYALPQSGTNSETGFIIFVPGFGGHIDSNVYKKMREMFADKYNVVTVQCDYFGSEYMQSSENFKLKNSFTEIAHLFTIDELKILKTDFTEILPIFSKKSSILPVLATQEEDDELFADMGFMQAIDVITSLEAIKNILKKSGALFNCKKVIGFGQSHGAYLLHLSNRLAPHLFSIIVDNSAWVVPEYLYENRMLYHQLGNSKLQIEFDYYAKYRIKDKAALHLENLYKDFENGAYIYSYLGTTDSLVHVDSKRKSIEHMQFVEYEVIDNTKVDGVIFKSTDHGLDSNFIELIDFIFLKKCNHINPNYKNEIYNITSSKTLIQVDYTKCSPLFCLCSIE